VSAAARRLRVGRNPPEEESTDRGGMYYEKNSRGFNLTVGLALGMMVGAALALLTAPRSGRRTRRRHGRVVSEVGETRGARWGRITNDLRTAVGPGWRSRRR
jgi:hypothetical protein